MPTVTQVSNHSVVNIGPLTTTSTAPASCTRGLMGVALSIYPFLGPRGVAMESCLTSRRSSSDCWPSGSALDEDWTSNSRGMDHGAFPIHYYSPASICPSGWATVGSVVRDGDDQVTSTWEFEPVATSWYKQAFGPQGGGFYAGPHHVWAQALDRGETGIACCPSSYTPLVMAGGCYSVAPLALYTADTACESTSSWDGPTRTGGSVVPYTTETVEDFGESWTVVLESTVGLPEGEYVTEYVNQGVYKEDGQLYFSRGQNIMIVENSDGEEVTLGFLPVSTVDMIFLAHGGTGSGDSPTGSGTGSEESGAAETGESDENLGGSHRTGLGRKVALVLGTWAVAMTIGAALMVPM